MISDEILKSSYAKGAKILDPCCGSRMMWIDKQNPNVIFGDRRCETITVTDRMRVDKPKMRRSIAWAKTTGFVGVNNP